MVARCKNISGSSVQYVSNKQVMRNIRCFDENYQPGKITLQISVLVIESIIAAPFSIMDGVTCAIFWVLIAV